MKNYSKQNKAGSFLLKLIALFMFAYAFVMIILPTGLYHLNIYKEAQSQVQNAPTEWPIEIEPLNVEELVNDAVNASQNSIIINEKPVTIIATGAPPAPIVPTTPAIAQPATLSPQEQEFLQSCASKQANGQRVSPRCPSSAADVLGEGR